MNLVNHEPFKRMSHLHEGIRNFFRNGDVLSAHSDDSHVATSQWLPSVDIKDEEDRFVICADIPGVAPKDIEVSMQNGVISIKGERKTEKKDEGNGYRRVECSCGGFYRRFSLPDTADADNITAKGKNGVLEITVGKREASNARNIPVKT